MKIDARLKEQSIRNQHGHNIYIHKQSKDNYAVGINGTSNHTTNLTKSQAESEVNNLLFVNK